MLAHRHLRRMYPTCTRKGLRFSSEWIPRLKYLRPWVHYKIVNRASAAEVAKRTLPKPNRRRRRRHRGRPSCHCRHSLRVSYPWPARWNSRVPVLCARLQVLHERSL
jgi:hypothetical protein